MANRTAEQAKSHYIEKMGDPLGTHFNALWQEVASLHMKWAEFVEMYGSKLSRVELLNQAAPQFFRMIQDALWEEILLHIARLTDEPRSLNRKAKANLTIRNLPEFISDITTKNAVAALLDVATTKAGFCRDWRNRHIAHRDLSLALNNSAVPLEKASRKQVGEALSAIAAVLNAVDAHYTDSETRFDVSSSIGGAVSLLYVLDDGVRAQACRRERRLRGELSKDDYPRDL